MAHNALEDGKFLVLEAVDSVLDVLQEAHGVALGAKNAEIEGDVVSTEDGNRLRTIEAVVPESH